MMYSIFDDDNEQLSQPNNNGRENVQIHRSIEQPQQKLQQNRFNAMECATDLVFAKHSSCNSRVNERSKRPRAILLKQRKHAQQRRKKLLV